MNSLLALLRFFLLASSTSLRTLRLGAEAGLYSSHHAKDLDVAKPGPKRGKVFVERKMRESWFFFPHRLFSLSLSFSLSLFLQLEESQRTKLTPAVVELGNLLPGRVGASEAREAPLAQRGASSSSSGDASSAAPAAAAASGLDATLVQLVLGQPREDVVIDRVEPFLPAAVPREARRGEVREQVEVRVRGLAAADPVAAGLVLGAALAAFAAAKDRVAVVVVPRPLLPVREDLVGVLDLLEAGRGALEVVLVFIWREGGRVREGRFEGSR